MRALQSIFEAFHQDIALRMYPPEKVMDRVLAAVKAGKANEQYLALENLGLDKSQMMSGFGVPAEKYFQGVYARIANADPTPQKKYAPWIMRMWFVFPVDGHGGYHTGTDKSSVLWLEDTGRVKQALEKLEEYKKNGLLVRLKRQVDQNGTIANLQCTPSAMEMFCNFLKTGCDINHLISHRQLEMAMLLADETAVADPNIVKSRKQAAESKEKEFYSNGGANLIVNTATLKIVQVLTEEASCFFGRNTQWCTAAKYDNAFRSYAGNGSLYIILEKQRNRRWQLYVPHSSTAYELMDEHDEETRWDELPPEAMNELALILVEACVEANSYGEHVATPEHEAAAVFAFRSFHMGIAHAIMCNSTNIDLKDCWNCDAAFLKKLQEAGAQPKIIERIKKDQQRSDVFPLYQSDYDELRQYLAQHYYVKMQNAGKWKSGQFGDAVLLYDLYFETETTEGYFGVFDSSKNTIIGTEFEGHTVLTKAIVERFPSLKRRRDEDHDDTIFLYSLRTDPVEYAKQNHAAQKYEKVETLRFKVRKGRIEGI